MDHHVSTPTPAERPWSLRALAPVVRLRFLCDNPREELTRLGAYRPGAQRRCIHLRGSGGCGGTRSRELRTAAQRLVRHSVHGGQRLALSWRLPAGGALCLGAHALLVRIRMPAVLEAGPRCWGTGPRGSLLSLRLHCV